LAGALGGGAVAMTAVMLAAWTCAFLVLSLATPAFRRGGWVQLA